MNKFAARFGALSALSGLAATSAMADPTADAVTALGTISVTSFATPLFALAVASVGISIAIAWIKKGKGAAR
jgi:hypothetical protein